jgi:flagellar biosynthesis/type III secretory pathway chaperone
MNMPVASSKLAAPVLQESHVRPLLAHLDIEESLLRDAKTALMDHHRRGDQEPRRPEKHLDELLQRLLETSQLRTVILRSYARALTVPEKEMTLGLVIRRSESEAAVAVSLARRRVTRLVRELQRLSSTTAWILQQSRQINLSLMDAVSGEQSSQRYDATGQVAYQPQVVRAESRS